MQGYYNMIADNISIMHTYMTHKVGLKFGWEYLEHIKSVIKNSDRYRSDTELHARIDNACLFILRDYGKWAEPCLMELSWPMDILLLDDNELLTEEEKYKYWGYAELHQPNVRHATRAELDKILADPESVNLYQPRSLWLWKYAIRIGAR